MSIAQSAESIALKTETNKKMILSLYAPCALRLSSGFIYQLDEVFYLHLGILLAQLVL